jgi:hypothetical protein
LVFIDRFQIYLFLQIETPRAIFLVLVKWQTIN